MKLTIQHVNVRSTDALDSLIENRILQLQTDLEIGEARVRLEHQHELSPPYRVQIHLETPGPDLFAEACEHTVLAAVRKALEELSSRAEHKKKRRNRKPDTLVKGAPAGRGAYGIKV